MTAPHPARRRAATAQIIAEYLAMPAAEQRAAYALRAELIARLGRVGLADAIARHATPEEAAP